MRTSHDARTSGRTQHITAMRGRRTMSYRHRLDAGQCPADTVLSPDNYLQTLLRRWAMSDTVRPLVNFR